jgi:hypothetical protein
MGHHCTLIVPVTSIIRGWCGVGSGFKVKTYNNRGNVWRAGATFGGVRMRSGVIDIFAAVATYGVPAVTSSNMISWVLTVFWLHALLCFGKYNVK